MTTGLSLLKVRDVKVVPATKSSTGQKLIIEFDSSAQLSNLLVVAGIAITLINNCGIDDVAVETDGELNQPSAIILTLPATTAVGFVLGIANDLKQRARRKGARFDDDMRLVS